MSNEFNAAKDREYFNEFKLKYPDVLKDFIRNQLIAGSKDAIASLEYFRNLLEPEAINAIIVTLNEQDRLTWKATIGREKIITDPSRLMTYVKNEMMKAFIASKPLVDPELLELTLKLKTHDVVKFNQAYPKDGGELLNLLNPTFISKMLDKLDMDQAQNFLESAWDAGTPGQKDSTLKENLKKFLNVSQKNSMASKLLKVLESIEPEKEKMIYAHVLKVTSSDELIETAVKNCHLEVLWLLPKTALNEVLQAYPLNKKARFLVSLDGERRDLLIQASSSEGSSARQMIEMEMKQIEENPQDLRRCQASSGMLTLEFLKFLRQHSQTSEQISSDIRLACNIWFSQLNQNSSQRAAA